MYIIYIFIYIYVYLYIYIYIYIYKLIASCAAILFLQVQSSLSKVIKRVGGFDHMLSPIFFFFADPRADVRFGLYPDLSALAKLITCAIVQYFCSAEAFPYESD